MEKNYFQNRQFIQKKKHTIFTSTTLRSTSALFFICSILESSRVFFFSGFVKSQQIVAVQQRNDV